MGLSKKRYEEQKTKEAERALQKIIGGINIGKIKVTRFELWPTGDKVNVSLQFHCGDEDDDNE